MLRNRNIERILAEDTTAASGDDSSAGETEATQSMCPGRAVKDSASFNKNIFGERLQGVCANAQGDVPADFYEKAIPFMHKKIDGEPNSQDLHDECLYWCSTQTGVVACSVFSIAEDRFPLKMGCYAHVDNLDGGEKLEEGKVHVTTDPRYSKALGHMSCYHVNSNPGTPEEKSLNQVEQPCLDVCVLCEDFDACQSNTKTHLGNGCAEADDTSCTKQECECQKDDATGFFRGEKCAPRFPKPTFPMKQPNHLHAQIAAQGVPGAPDGKCSNIAGPAAACVLSPYSDADTCSGSLEDPSCKTGYDLMGGRPLDKLTKSFCRANRVMEFSVLQYPKEGEDKGDQDFHYDDSCFLVETDLTDPNARINDNAGKEPYGWRGNNISWMFLDTNDAGRPKSGNWTKLNLNLYALGENNGDVAEGIVPDGYTSANNQLGKNLLHSQHWRQRERFSSDRVTYIALLMGLLCAFISVMEFTSSFMPEEHAMREVCDLKAILRGMIISIFCPCLGKYAKKPKKPDQTKIVPKAAPLDGSAVTAEEKQAVAFWEVPEEKDPSGKDELKAAGKEVMDAALDAGKEELKSAAKDAAKDMASEALSGMDLGIGGEGAEGGSACEKLLKGADDFFAYFFVSLPFNFLIASYTTVGPSLLSTDSATGKIARKDGSGVWLMSSDVASKVVNLPFILMMVMAGLCFFAAPLVAWIIMKKDAEKRTSENIIMANREKKGEDIGPAPAMIRTRNVWKRWKSKRPKVPACGKPDLEHTADFLKKYNAAKNQKARNSVLIEEFGRDVIADPDVAHCKEQCSNWTIILCFLAWFGVTCFIFYNQFKDLFTANLKLGLPKLNVQNILFGIPVPFQVPSAQLPTAVFAFGYSSLSLGRMGTKLIKNVVAKLASVMGVAQSVADKASSVQVPSELPAVPAEASPAEGAPTDVGVEAPEDAGGVTGALQNAGEKALAAGQEKL
jgi:hypothetical protein